MPVLPFIPPSFPPGISCPSNVLMHTQVQDELKDIIKKNPAARVQLRSQLNARLEFLSNNLGQETRHKWFEHLKDAAPYKSIRFAHVKLLDNLRILYCISNQTAYLLIAFTEQNTSDYTHALSIAEHRAAGIP